MTPRVLLVALIVAASAAFVVGVALERSAESDHHETSAASTAHREQPANGEQSESEAAHAAETAKAATAATADLDAGDELRPVGIDIEA